MGAAILEADLWAMKRNGCTRDLQDDTAEPRASLNSPVPATDVSRLRSGFSPICGLTPYECWAIESRIAQISAALRDLDAYVRRLRQGGRPFAPGAPGASS